ncbi:AAA family ATPase [Streptomyces sp. NPDC058220]|uniref:AAA family ATPase n=1 Tax=Streptomyces sp. NPDC058220 TaxID=3346387 RepID=UPI0036ED7A36
MSMYLDREEQRQAGFAGTFAIGSYGAGRRDRGHVEKAREGFMRACGRLGFGVTKRLEGTGTHEDVERGITQFERYQALRKIFYWTGHGLSQQDDYYLACGDSYLDGPGDTVVPARSVNVDSLVGRLKSQTSEVLIVIDACYSQSLLAWIRQRFLVNEFTGKEAAGSGFALVCTAGVERTVDEGQWADWLEAVLDDPATMVDERVHPFQESVPYVPFSYLMKAVNSAAADDGVEDPSRLPAFAEIRLLDGAFLHNPYFNEGRLPRTAVRPAEHDATFLEELDSRFVRSLAGDARTRSMLQFTGRLTALSRMVKWQESHASGLLAVTGPAGSGKTTLLSRLAHLSIPRYLDSLDSPPPLDAQPRPGSIHAALPCFGKTLHELCADLCHALEPLGIEPPAHGDLTPDACVAQVAALAQKAGVLNLVFDGLDEAAAGQAHDIARDLLNRLAASPGVKVLVGTRVQPRRVLPGRVLEETLYEALDQTVPALALDLDKDADGDIARYAEAVLSAEGSPYARPEADGERSRAATRIARHSSRLFLVADLSARALAGLRTPLSADRLDDFLHAGNVQLKERITAEIRHLDPDGSYGLEPLLRPLALAQGSGLPLTDVWLAMANALRRDGSRKLTDQQLRNLPRIARGSLITKVADDEGDEIYRFQHPSFGSHLLADTAAEQRAWHSTVFAALNELCQEDWGSAGTYIQRHLGAHAALGGPGELEYLINTADYLLHADPDVMLPLVVPLVPDSDRADLYRRVAGTFRHRPAAADRWALLSATALAGHPRALDHMEPPPSVLWKDIWTDAGPEPFHQSWQGPAGGACAVSWSPAAGGLISASGRGEIVTHLADTGRRVRVHQPKSDPGTGRVPLRNVAELGRGHRRTVVGLDGSNVHIWPGNRRLPRQSFFWGGSPDSLSASEFGGTAHVAAADGHRVWLWQWPVEAGPSTRGLRHALIPVRARRVTLLPLADRHFLLAGGHDTVTLHEFAWRPREGDSPLGPETLLAQDVEPVLAVAAVVQGDNGAWLAAADGIHVRVWRLTAEGYGQPVVEHALEIESGARGIAVGHAGDTPLLAIQEQGRIRVRRIADQHPYFSFSAGDQHASLAFDPEGTGRLAVADGSAVRVLQTTPGQAGGDGARGRPHRERVIVHLATGDDGRHLLCRVSHRTVLLTLHRSNDSREAAAPLVLDGHPKQVTAVSALRTGACWTVASVTGGTVHIWRVADDLKAPVKEDEFDMGADPGESVSAVGVAVVGGQMLAFAPLGQELRCWATAAGQTRQWRPVSPMSLQGGASIDWTGSVSANGRTWLAANGVTSIGLWELSRLDGSPVVRTVRTPLQAQAVAVGGHLEGTEFVPLLAWLSSDGRVRVARCDRSRPEGDKLKGDFSQATSLVFTGGRRRPLLLVCGGGSTAVAIWDVVGKRWLSPGDVPDRGYQVERAAAAFDDSGITLMLQGRNRCDQLFLGRKRLAERMGISSFQFS